MLKDKVKKIHFVGIGGIGMSGIALIMLEMGYTVTGSDIKENKNISLLRKRGAKIYIGHSPLNVVDSDVVVYSSAIREDNEELLQARKLKIPTVSRGEMLAELFRIKEGIAVSGSHGKTTTTSMIASILEDADMDPTVIIGGILKRLGSNAKLGKGNLIVSEADESDGSFLKLTPTIAVINNIDREHLDFYKSFENIKDSFLKFANSVPFYGVSILNTDDIYVKTLQDKINRRMITYGIKSGDVKGENIRIEGSRYCFDVYYKNSKLGSIKLGIPGIHNIYNALASISVSLELGIGFPLIRQALEEFRNAERRLELKGFVNGNPVYDDYGHHPTEIEAVIKTLREIYPERKIVLVFQPHRYTRVKLLFRDFARVLKLPDECFITEIYPAGEEAIEGVSGYALSKECGRYFCKDKEELLEILHNVKDAVILFMGAGSITKWCEEFVDRFMVKH